MVLVYKQGVSLYSGGHYYSINSVVIVTVLSLPATMIGIVPVVSVRIEKFRAL